MDLDPRHPRANGATGAGSSPISSAPNSPQRPDLYYSSASRAPGRQIDHSDGPKNYPQGQDKLNTPTLATNEANPKSNNPKPSSKQGSRAGTTSATTSRKKADSATAALTGASKEKKPRKPRDPNAAPTRKRQKTSADPKTTDPKTLGGNGQNMQPPASMDSQRVAGNSTNPDPAAAQTMNTSPRASLNPNIQRNEAVHPSPRPSSRGQRYDPVRSMVIENNPLQTNSVQHAPPNPSRSNPSIANLISHPSDEQQKPAQVGNVSSSSYGMLGSSNRPTDTNFKLTQDPSSVHHSSSALKVSDFAPPPENTNDHNSVKANASLPPAKLEAARNKTPPKAPRRKDPAPPVPLGSGLLSGAAFGRSDAEPRHYAEVPNQCIIIDVPVVAQNTNYVNFMKEVEQKYGFDVAHPRLAEHRKRMKEVAAAGAALESGPVSADEMNLDASEGDSMEIVAEGSTVEAAPKKRRNKEDEYNKEDDFIDDTELAWEEQALASKDGYFVWSGPLVPKGEKPNVERADGTGKRGARGGRGRGGATRGETTSRSRTTGAGRGARGGANGAGGGTARKSRVTKADKAKMESEKQEREKMAATAAKPSQYPGAS
ncbi:MAG: hypothetical protein M1831_005260 [Alyxoria varia]|nr:MAG: hypothetical protein M1831_005260 [Alyxoria varia]